MTHSSFTYTIYRVCSVELESVMSVGKIINPCSHRILSCISHVRSWAGQQSTETEYSNETKQNAHFLTSLLRNAFVFLLLSESPIANIDKSFLFSASGTPLLHTQSEHPTAFHYSAPATRSESPKYGGWREMDVLSFRFCFAGYSNRFCISPSVCHVSQKTLRKLLKNRSAKLHSNGCPKSESEQSSTYYNATQHDKRIVRFSCSRCSRDNFIEQLK